jgi:hypothetical protein
LYFKLSDQLKVYYAQWRKSSDTKEALTRSAGVRKPLADVIHDPTRSAAAPPIPFQAAKPHVVEKGFLNVERGPSPTASNSKHFPGPQYHHPTDTIHSEFSSTLSAQPQPSNSTPSSEIPNAPIVTTRETVERLARKRVADSLAEHRPAKKARKRRTCMKCARLTCSGSQTVKNCRNPCQDCQKTIGCRGRNSKKPSTLCHLAWD